MTTRYHHDPLLPPPQGGGTQRLFLEQRTRVSKVTRVLLTHLGTDTVGGLPGLVLTLADAGTRPELKVAGPVGLRGFVRAATPFMHRQFFTTTCEECRKDATVFPHALEITAVRVTRGQAAAGSGGGGSGCNREGEGGGEGGGGGSADVNPAPAKRARTDESTGSGGGEGGAAANNLHFDAASATGADPDAGNVRAGRNGVVRRDLWCTACGYNGHGDKFCGGLPDGVPKGPHYIDDGAGANGVDDDGEGPMVNLSYLLKIPQIRGKFDVEAARRLNVPAGPR